jgi:hypothetical protein
VIVHLSWCVLFDKNIVSENHPPFWSYVRLISYLHITQVLTKLHGGNENNRTAIKYPPKYQVAIPWIIKWSVNPPQTPSHVTISRAGLTQPLHSNGRNVAFSHFIVPVRIGNSGSLTVMRKYYKNWWHRWVHNPRSHYKLIASVGSQPPYSLQISGIGGFTTPMSLNLDFYFKTVILTYYDFHNQESHSLAYCLYSIPQHTDQFLTVKILLNLLEWHVLRNSLAVILLLYMLPISVIELAH